MKELLEVGQSAINRSVLLKNQSAGRVLRKLVQKNNISKVRQKLADGVTNVALGEQCCCIEIAITKQYIDILKVLLKMLGPNLNGSEYIVTIINKAVTQNNLDIIKTTLDYLAMYLDNEESAQVLRSAVEKGNVKVIKNVLENLGTYISKENYQDSLRVNNLSCNFNKHKINVILEKFNNETKYYSIIPFNNNSSKKPSTNYHYFIENSQSKKLRQKVLNGDIEGVQKIIDDGVTTINKESIIIAVRIAIHNYAQQMLSILITIPASPIKEQDLGYLLKETVLNNNPEIVQTLLETLAPEINNKYAEESLLLAVTKNNVEVVNNILKDLGPKISIDCLKSALHIARINKRQEEIDGLLQSQIARYEATPKSLAVTKSNAQNQRTNLLRSKSIDGSPDHNIPSTENNPRNDFKTGNNNNVDESKRSTSQDGHELNKDNGEDLNPDQNSLSPEEYPENGSSVGSETSLAESDDGTHSKSNPNVDDMRPILEIGKTHTSSSDPNDFDGKKEIENLHISPKFTQELQNIMQNNIEAGKKIIDLKAKSKNTKQSDRVPTRDIILESKEMHYLKTEIDILKLDVKKIKEDLKKYIPHVITNYAVHAFSSNNDNQIFPKGNDDIIVNNYNPSNRIEELFSQLKPK